MGLSQLDFAQLIGMNRSYYASIEVGERNVTLSSMDKISHGFKVSIATLVEGIDRDDPNAALD
jgi:transcriptional regulator with XRE-family HTH domain